MKIGKSGNRVRDSSISIGSTKKNLGNQGTTTEVEISRYHKGISFILYLKSYSVLNFCRVGMKSRLGQVGCQSKPIEYSQFFFQK